MLVYMGDGEWGGREEGYLSLAMAYSRVCATVGSV